MPAPNGTTEASIGYGYNWGILAGVYLGVVMPRVSFPGGYIQPGIPIASIDAPADMFVYGDTGDNPRYTICTNYIYQYYINATKSSQMRHGGRLNMSFADGHAKSVNFKAGLLGSGVMGLPKSKADQVKYCRDMTSIVDLPLCPKCTCPQWANWVDTNTAWFPD